MQRGILYPILFTFLLGWMPNRVLAQVEPIDPHLRQYKKNYNAVLRARSMNEIQYPYYTEGAMYEYLTVYNSPLLDQLNWDDANDRDTVPGASLLFYSYDHDSQRLHCWLLYSNGLYNYSHYGYSDVSEQELIELERKFYLSLRARSSIALNRGMFINYEEETVEPTKHNRELCDVIFPNGMADTLKKFSGILVSPVLNIGTIPWYCLQPFEDSTFAVDHWNIQILESLNHFSSYIMRGKDQMNPYSTNQFTPINPIIVGNPNFASCDLEPLPGAEKEAKLVARIMNATPIERDSAWQDNLTDWTSDSTLKFKGDFIYLATHAVSDMDAPMDSSVIYLSDRNGDCHSISARDILYTQKHPETIVILSACETGLGRKLTGGVIGLTRSFLINGVNDGYPSDNFYGARNVVMSLWSVNDAATQELMARFMTKMLMPHDLWPISPLRQAILEFKQKDPDLLHWGAFQTMGLAYPPGIEIKLVP